METIQNIVTGKSPQPRTSPSPSSTAKRNIIMPISLCTKNLLIGLTKHISKAKEENNLSLLCDIAQIKTLLENPDSQGPGRSATNLTRNLVTDFKIIRRRLNCRNTDITLHVVFADGCLYENNIRSQLNIDSADPSPYDPFIKQALKKLQEAILEYYQPALEYVEGLAGGSTKFYTWDQFIESEPVSYDALAYAGRGNLWDGIIAFSKILKPGIKDNAAGNLKVLEDELGKAYTDYQEDHTSLTLSSLKHVKKNTPANTVKEILKTIQSSATKYNNKRNKNKPDNSLDWSVRYIIHEMIALALHIQQKTDTQTLFIQANHGNRKGSAIPDFLVNIKTGLAETILNGLLAPQDKTNPMGNIYVQPPKALKWNPHLRHIKINNNFAPQFFKNGTWPSKNHEEHLALLEQWVTRPEIINDVYQLLTSSLYLKQKALPIIYTPEFQTKLAGLNGKESQIKSLVKESQDNFIFAYLRYSIKNSPYPAILIVVFFLSIYSSIYMTPNAPAHMLTLAMIASLFSITLILSALDYRQCRAAADKIYSVLIMQTNIDAYFSIPTSSNETRKPVLCFAGRKVALKPVDSAFKSVDNRYIRPISADKNNLGSPTPYSDQQEHKKVNTNTDAHNDLESPAPYSEYKKRALMGDPVATLDILGDMRDSLLRGDGIEGKKLNFASSPYSMSALIVEKRKRLRNTSSPHGFAPPHSSSGLSLAMTPD